MKSKIFKFLGVGITVAFILLGGLFLNTLKGPRVRCQYSGGSRILKILNIGFPQELRYELYQPQADGTTIVTTEDEVISDLGETSISVSDSHPNTHVRWYRNLGGEWSPPEEVECH